MNDRKDILVTVYVVCTTSQWRVTCEVFHRERKRRNTLWKAHFECRTWTVFIYKKPYAAWNVYFFPSCAEMALLVENEKKKPSQSMSQKHYASMIWVWKLGYRASFSIDIYWYTISKVSEVICLKKPNTQTFASFDTVHFSSRICMYCIWCD